MGRTRRVAALATTGATGAALLAFAIGTSSAATQVDPASRAIEYLQGQQSGSDGSIPVGASTATVSEEYAIGAAAAGYDPNALRHGSGPSVMAYLAAHAAGACTSAGACGELLQAVAAAGLNPASFGGVDLLTTLNGFYSAGSGVFGNGEAFTQALAIQGLVAAHHAVPAAALRHLVAAQDSDGGWDYLLIKDDPNGPTNFDTSDTNSTAMVLMALDAAGMHSRDRSALAWLHTQQDSDGGFPYQAGSGGDPDSTALVLQALVATGQNPQAPPWSPGGHSPLAELIATQGSSGGFTFPGNPAPDPFTTAQVPPALERAALPLTCGSTRCFQIGSTLNGTAPTPTPVPTPSPKPRPTSAPEPSGTGSATATPAPTGAVLGVTATPIGPTSSAAPTSPGAGPTPTTAPALAVAPSAGRGFPTAAVYVIAALAAAFVAAGVPHRTRRRGGT
ncbi:MAG: hypothetical protein ACHQ4F_01370 [Candidatus Dormibacteria bacterium]